MHHDSHCPIERKIVLGRYPDRGCGEFFDSLTIPAELMEPGGKSGDGRRGVRVVQLLRPRESC